jgi:ribosome-associated protein
MVTGRNERNVQSIADEIEDQALNGGRKALRREGRDLGRWILLDYGDAVAHVFHEEERTFYGLERLWRDCPVIPVSSPAGPS